MVISIEDNKEYSLKTIEDKKRFILLQKGSRLYQCYILLDEEDQLDFLKLCSEAERRLLWESAWRYAAEQGVYDEKMDELERRYGDGEIPMLAALRLVWEG